MSRGTDRERRLAGLTAALLVVLGAILGVAVDRTLLRAPAAAAVAPLTFEAMAEDLDLDTLARERVRARLDSLDATVTRAAQLGADSLRAAARQAHHELEAALPDDRRQEFSAWMDRHRTQMMSRMRGGGMHGGPHGMMDSRSLHVEEADSDGARQGMRRQAGGRER